MNEQIKFPAGTAFGSIGHPIRRKEDARLLTGKGRFTDDFSLEGQTYAAMVRSPHPHARIVKHRHRRGEADARRAAGADRRGLQRRRPQADSAFAGAVDRFRHEADRPAWRAGLHRPAHAAARRQGAPCRRAGGDGRCARRARRRWMPPKRSRSNTRNCRIWSRPTRRSMPGARAALGRSAGQRAGRFAASATRRPPTAPSKKPRMW